MTRHDYGRKPWTATEKPAHRFTYRCTEKWWVSRGRAVTDEIAEREVLERFGLPGVLQLMAPAREVAPLVSESIELRGRRDDVAVALDWK